MAILVALALLSAPEGLIEKTETIAFALEQVDLEGWQAAGPAERYVVANLYDKINGRSELFMAYGVEGLAFQTFRNASDSTQYIDVFLYDMATAPGAFGVYSVERWPDQETLKLGRDGYRNDNDVFFWKGRYYASILASGDEPSVRKAQMSLAEQLAKALEDSGDMLWGFEVLPMDDVVRDTVQFFMVDALSLGFMNDTYTAEFKSGNDRISVFVSRADSSEAAQERHDKYVEYMRRYGSSVDESTSSGVTLTIADMGGGYHDVIFRDGRHVAGVTAVPEREAALAAAAAWRNAMATKLR